MSGRLKQAKRITVRFQSESDLQAKTNFESETFEMLFD